MKNYLYWKQVLLFFTTFLLSGMTLVSAMEDGYKLPRTTVSAEFPYTSRYTDVLGSNMHYIEQGQGDAILFIHGNPTSSYLWRNIIPFVSGTGRAIAVDLIGMGKSDKPDIDYTFLDHYAYLEKFIENSDLHNITLVLHDWGAALGFEYARRHKDNVVGIAFMEGALPPVFPAEYSSLSPLLADFFKLLKDPILGPQYILEQNGFVEQLIPQMVNRPLTLEEMNFYREPYLEIAARRPVFVWPQEVPIGGQPQSTVTVLNNIELFMEHSELPMLLLYASPGAIVTSEVVTTYIEMINHLETLYIGQGFHYIQEDQPEAIGRGLADWMRREIGDSE